MIYKYDKGRKVCHEGFVIIEGVRHYIKNGCVVCDPTLNERAWNVTEEKGVCEECTKDLKFKQLKFEL